MTKQQQKLEALYYKFLPMAHSLAQRLGNRHGIPGNEIHEEAESIWAVIVAEWPDTYDPAKCGECHWAYQQLYWRLLDYCTRRPHVRHEVAEVSEREPVRQGWMENFLRVLGEDAKIVVQTILHAPGEIVEEIMPRGSRPRTRTRNAVEDYLEDRLGWSLSRFDSAWREVCFAVYGDSDSGWTLAPDGRWVLDSTK